MTSNKEPGDHKEDVDTEVAPLKPTDSGVKEDNKQHRYASQTLYIGAHGGSQSRLPGALGSHNSEVSNWKVLG